MKGEGREEGGKGERGRAGEGEGEGRSNKGGGKWRETGRHTKWGWDVVCKEVSLPLHLCQAYTCTYKHIPPPKAQA